MARTNKLTLHFYMNGKDGGEIEVSLAYGSCRYYGGRTTICNSRKFFDQFNPDGTLKTELPFEKTGLVPDCLGIIRKSVLDGMNERLKKGQDIDDTAFEQEMDKAVEKMWIYKSAWIAGRNSIARYTDSRKII